MTSANSERNQFISIQAGYLSKRTATDKALPGMVKMSIKKELKITSEKMKFDGKDVIIYKMHGLIMGPAEFGKLDNVLKNTKSLTAAQLPTLYE